MDSFKDFQGKTLDDAIKDACSYFNANRERLEIEIIQDAKTGIFGIVGSRKAKIRARRVRLREAVESVLGNHYHHDTDTSDISSLSENKSGAASVAVAPPERSCTATFCEDDQQGISSDRTSLPHGSPDDPIRICGNSSSRSAHKMHLPRVGRKNASSENIACSPAECERSKGGSSHESKDGASSEATFSGSPSSPHASIDSPALDYTEEGDAYCSCNVSSEEISACVIEVVRRLMRSLVDGEADINVSVSGDRVQVSLANAEDCGLLIGREGLTLASIQYLASRIVARKLQASIRIQIDVGDYRQRQDDKLREMARTLAEKVLQSGHSQSTRPLSSYHRRVVHLFLKDMDGIQTRSTGEGAMKRVVIMRKKTTPQATTEASHG